MQNLSTHRKCFLDTTDKGTYALTETVATRKRPAQVKPDKIQAQRIGSGH